MIVKNIIKVALIWLLCIGSSQISMMADVLIPKIKIDKTEIDYCNPSTTAKEFVLSVELGEIYSSDSLTGMNVYIAYEKDKVVLDMALVYNTLAAQITNSEYIFIKHYTEFDDVYNYLSFSATNIEEEVGGKIQVKTLKGNLPLIKIRGVCKVDSIDELKFSIPKIVLPNEFKRDYDVDLKDTARLSVKALEKAERTIQLVSNTLSHKFDKPKDTVQIDYKLNISNSKHLNDFMVEFLLDEVDDEYDNFEIKKFQINELFDYGIIEQNSAKLVLKISIPKQNQQQLSGETDFVQATIVRHAQNSIDTIKNKLKANIYDVNLAACSKQSLPINTELISVPNAGSIVEEQDGIVQIDYDHINRCLKIESDKYIKSVKMIDLLGQDIINNDLTNQTNAVIDLSTKQNGIYFIEIHVLNKEVIRKKIVIN